MWNLLLLNSKRLPMLFWPSFPTRPSSWSDSFESGIQHSEPPCKSQAYREVDTHAFPPKHDTNYRPQHRGWARPNSSSSFIKVLGRKRGGKRNRKQSERGVKEESGPLQRHTLTSSNERYDGDTTARLNSIFLQVEASTCAETSHVASLLKHYCLSELEHKWVSRQKHHNLVNFYRE